MTPKQALDQLFDLRQQWATDSNDPGASQTRLFELCEAFIEKLDSTLEEAGFHPDPPPPRVR